jgi:hypothetical protein
MLPDSADINTYGGVLVNDGEIENPETDQDADAFNEMKNDVAMMTHMRLAAMRRFVGHATTPAEPGSGFIHDALWGSAPAVKPAVTKLGTGIYKVAWPQTVADELGATKTLNLRVARAWVEITGSTRYSAEARTLSAYEVEVRVFTNAGALDDAATFTIVAQAW